MSSRAIVLALGIISSLLPSAHASPSDEASRRATVPNTVARQIAGELFPEQCGSGGEGCGIVYGPSLCPLQFVITIPAQEGGLSSWQSLAFVTIDKLGRVVEVRDSPNRQCRNGIAS
jgi:hypothetical protein